MGSDQRRYPRRPARAGSAAVLGTAAVALAVVATPHAAYAAEPAPVMLAVDSIAEVVGNIRIWMMGILAAWATLCLTVGFFRYTSGEPGEVEKGKLALRSAAIGYAGALLAPLLLTIVGEWVA
nr:pilin [Asanoa siamensis]